MPPKHAAGGPVPSADTLTRRSRRGRARGVAVTVTVSAVVVAGVLVWRVLPMVTDDGGEPRNSPLAVTSAPAEPESSSRDSEETTGPVEEPADEPTEEPVEENLLTTAGIQSMIATIKPTLGTKIVKMSVHPTHASIDVPLKDDPTLYDTYDYRDGAIGEPRRGGEVKTRLMDLEKFNWDALPALLKRAKTDLGVPKPTSHHLIVDPDYVFLSTKQVLLVYASDDYGRSGYLVANPQGKVLRLLKNS